ncbi:SGNH/GDSL hydrolase family protein [Asticcacaulis solisilvae]|uniref:SGNH/GDSL hydrolase family protein n=1 Tax=Asticcacaulis solisilvae TaxID=1217274 RepID=UPI003FD80728
MKTLALGAILATLGAVPVHAAEAGHWVTAWASAQVASSGKNALAPEDAADITLRQVVRVTAGGARIRVHLSNVFGTEPLVIGRAGVAGTAQGDRSGFIAGRSRPLTFGGAEAVTIAPGAEAVSDPVDLPVAAFDDLSVSLWQARTPQVPTGHVASHATSFVVHGDHVADATLSAPKAVEHWYEISGVDVEGPQGAIAVLGDSITDGSGMVANSNARWPDFLARRLHDTGSRLSVINLGIGGNRVLHDGTGPRALARFDRDILDRDGVRFVVIFEGVNDLGSATREHPIDAEAHAQLVVDLEAGYVELAARARARGLKVIGATIAPFAGSPIYHPDAANEADRQAVNAWIRAPGHFDGVIDFDRVLADPAAPDHLRAEYDSGDHLHPAPGYPAMAGAIDLDLFR